MGPLCKQEILLSNRRGSVVFVLMVLLSFLITGCKDDTSSEPQQNVNGGDITMDYTNRDKLYTIIKAQPEYSSIVTKEMTAVEFRKAMENYVPTPSPVVTLEQFFEGNDDLGSIGCNLIPHPGISAFYDTLRWIRSRSDVQNVLIEISQIDDELDWAFSEQVYIYTSASEDEVAAWVAKLQPDEIGFSNDWPYGKPNAASKLADGMKICGLWWD